MILLEVDRDMSLQRGLKNSDIYACIHNQGNVQISFNWSTFSDEIAMRNMQIYDSFVVKYLCQSLESSCIKIINIIKALRETWYD